MNADGSSTPDVDPLRAEEVLEETLRAPVSERSALLDRLCGGDSTLREEVSSLLGHLPDPENPEDPATPWHELVLEGRSIGGCRLESLLGRGGTGRVYRATQEWPPRPVAVKVLRPELLAEGARRRFRREARALARLDHPGIARILFAGMHRDGAIEVPFVVMELVDQAQTLTAWWRSTRRTLAERLELFATVCDAVHHGHVRGLVHRDLKPSNVLVGGDGRAKVIDFSVASMTTEDAGMMTLTRAIAGTPGYMSPEQFEGGVSVDLRTDVHALGLLLFECLAGRPAFAREGLSLASAARLIGTETAPSLESIDPSLAGDLDTIVRHALEKAPENRYQSAAALASDIRCHLSGHPIVARPTTPMMRMRLFARRNPLAAAALLAATIAIVVGSSGSILFGIREARAAERAEAALRATERALWRSRLSEFGRAIETSDLAMLNVHRKTIGSDESWPARLLHCLSDESVAVLDGISQYTNFSAMGGAISPDATVLAIVMDQGNGVVLLDPATLRPIRTLTPGLRSWAVAFDPVNQRLLTAQDHELFVWDKPWVDPPRRIPLPFAYGTGIAPSPDGRRVALSSEGNTCVVDLEEGRVTARTNDVSGSTTRVAWSPDGSRIAVGVEPRSVRLYRPDDLSEAGRVPADSQRVLALDFDPTGRFLAFAGDMRRLHVVEVANPANRRTLPLDHAIWGLRWHPDGSRIAIADRGSGVRLVAAPADGPLSLIGSFVGHDSEVWAVDWSPSGERLYSIGQTQVHAWNDTPSGGVVQHELGAPGLHLAHRSDGTALALTADATIWAVAAEPGSRPERVWSGGSFTAVAAAADPAHERFAWGGASGRVLLAHPRSGRMVTRQHAMSEDGPSCIVFSPSGSIIAIIGKSPADPLLLLDAESGDAIATVAMQWTIPPSGIAWVDEETLFVGSFGGGQEIRRQADGRWTTGRTIPGSFFSVRGVTRDGSILAADMSGFIVERRLSDGSTVRSFARVSDMATCTALSPDDTLLAASGTDRRLHVFERRSGEQLLSLLGHARGRRVMAVDFSAGGARVLTLDNGGGLTVWDTRPIRVSADTKPDAQ